MVNLQSVTECLHNTKLDFIITQKNILKILIDMMIVTPTGYFFYRTRYKLFWTLLWN